MTGTSRGALARRSDRIIDCPASTTVMDGGGFFADRPCATASAANTAMKTPSCSVTRTAGILYRYGRPLPGGGHFFHPADDLPSLGKLGYDANADEPWATAGFENRAGDRREQRDWQADCHCAGAGGLRLGVGR